MCMAGHTTFVKERKGVGEGFGLTVVVAVGVGVEVAVLVGFGVGVEPDCGGFTKDVLAVIDRR